MFLKTSYIYALIRIYTQNRRILPTLSVFIRYRVYLSVFPIHQHPIGYKYFLGKSSKL